MLSFFADSVNTCEEDNAQEDIKQEHDTDTVKKEGFQNYKPQKAHQQEQEPALPAVFIIGVINCFSHS